MKTDHEELPYTRTDAMTEKINAVSNIIKDLNITHEQNDRLVTALTELQSTTEKEMLAQGMAISLSIFEKENTIIEKKERDDEKLH